MSDYIKREDAINEAVAMATAIPLPAEVVRTIFEQIHTADVFEKDLLTDRPCAVCKYNTAEKGCTKWDCAFGI